MISLSGVTLRAGNFTLNANLTVDNNEYLVVLGQSGCGKTMLLESICGLRQVTAGTLHIDGKNCTTAEPRFRKIGYVPQEGALFENLTVEKNIGFGLRVACWKREDISKRVLNLTDMLSITPLLKRRVYGLSGGERQRVALARALAVSPSVMLFDEPVSAVDESARNAICKDLEAHHKRLQIPFIHVCHSVEETSIVANKVAIMRNGAIIREGTLDALSDHPGDCYTAGLLKVDNVLKITACSGQNMTYAGGVELRGSIPAGGAAVMIHPWDVQFAEGNEEVNCLKTVVKKIKSRGAQVELVLVAGNETLKMFSTAEEVSQRKLSPGVAVTVSLPPERLQALAT